MAGVDLFPVTTPPSLEEVDPVTRVSLMVEWFSENFEDPVNDTPYDGKEGGYQFIWGGPYDARDELEGAFPEATEEEIEEAIDEIEADGTVEWAPNGARIRELDDDEVAADVVGPEESKPIEERLAELAGQLNEIQAHIQFWRDRPAGLGHNSAQFEMTIAPDDEDLLAAEQSVSEIRAELAKPSPATQADIEVVERAEGRFRKLASKIKNGLLALGLFTAVSVGGGFFDAVGADIYNNPQRFMTVLNSAATNLSGWASHLHMPF